MFTFLQGSALTLPTYFLDQGQQHYYCRSVHLVLVTRNACHMSGCLDWIDQSLHAAEDHMIVLREAALASEPERGVARERAVNLSHSQNCGRYTVYTVHTLFKNMCI